MNKVRVLTWLVIGLLALNLALMATHFFKPKKGNHGPPKVERILNFDADQKDQFADLVDAHRTSTKAVKEEISVLSNKYYNLENASERDSIYQVIENRNAEIFQLNLDHFEEVKKLCRPEQLKNFPKFLNVITSEKRPKHGKGRKKK